jgi:hypothetical protein
MCLFTLLRVSPINAAEYAVAPSNAEPTSPNGSQPTQPQEFQKFVVLSYILEQISLVLAFLKPTNILDEPADDDAVKLGDVVGNAPEIERFVHDKASALPRRIRLVIDVT